MGEYICVYIYMYIKHNMYNVCHKYICNICRYIGLLYIHIYVYIYMYMFIYIKVYYKELAHMIVDTGKSKIFSVLAGLRPRGTDGTIPVLRQSSGEFPLFKSSSTKEASLFVPLRPSTDWMRPTHVIIPQKDTKSHWSLNPSPGDVIPFQAASCSYFDIL